MVERIQKPAVISMASRAENSPGISSTTGSTISRAMTPPAEPMAQPLPDTRPISSGRASSGRKPS